MYKIKLLSRMSGPTGNYSIGSILDVELQQAKDLINGGYAQALDPIIEEEPKKEVVSDTKKKKR